jgi:hypothetical protein
VRVVRRLLLALAVLASLVLVMTTGAGAAKSGPHLTIKGAAHASGSKLQGGFAVENTGTAKAAALTATVTLRGAPYHQKMLIIATVQHASIPALAPGDRQRVKIKATIPKKAKSGTWSIVACAGQCVTIGRLNSGAPKRKKATAPNAAVEPAPIPPQSPAPCIPAAGPIPYTAGQPFKYACGIEYWGFVPTSYNAATPMPLLIWMHGCGGNAEGDAWVVGPPAEEEAEAWLTLSLGGRDGFRNSSTFASLLIENSAPYFETELTKEESLAAPTKLHIVHLAHTGDTQYPIAMVHEETEAVEEAGFLLELIERPGEHFDANTDKDLREVLLPYIDAGWASP